MPECANLSWRIPITTGDAAEEQLVRAVLAGERGAWERLAEPHREYVRSLVSRYVRDHDDADDLTQAILLRAYRKLSQFQNDSRFATWLHSIAVRMCLDFLKQRKPERVPLDEIAFTLADQRTGSNTESAALLRFETERLLWLVNQLPRHLGETLFLIAVYGLSEAETAEWLGCPLGTVKSRLYRAREKMRLAETGD